MLRGTGESLRKFHPTLIIELWNNELGVTVKEALTDCDHYYFDLTTEIPEPTQHIHNDSPYKRYINYLVCTPVVAQAIDLLT